MYEAEIKARVRDLESLQRALTAQGIVFGEPIVEDDTVYVKNVGSIETYVSNDAFLRIREKKDLIIFTYKYHPGRTAHDPLSAPREYELGIDSRTEMEAILALEGYQEAVRIHKVRRKGMYKNWELCLDEVTGLGAFLEVEERVDSEEAVPQVIANITAFLADVGIAPEDQGAQRYDVALLERR